MKSKKTTESSSDFVQQIGPLALASRLKQVSELLYEQVGTAYKSLGIKLSARFFPLFYTLTLEPHYRVTTLAKKLRTNHPAVSQMVSELIKQGLVITETAQEDIRCTNVKLSADGQRLAELLRPIWEDIEKSIRELLDETRSDLIGALNEFERHVQEKGLSNLILKRNELRNRKTSSSFELELEEWSNGNYEHLYFFERLTVEWFSEYGFKVESVDTKVFADPAAMIINPGGKIFFARFKGTIVGVAALIRKDSKTMELARMAVTKTARGKGIGKVLALRAIEEAKRMGMKELYLETNSVFKEASKLYSNLGFILDKNAKLHYARADQLFRMKLST